MKSVFFIFSILFIFMFMACDEEKDSLKQSEGVTLVCLGDSYTAGYGATTPYVEDSTKSYPAYKKKKVNIPVINAGVSGNTASQGLDRVSSDVLAHSPGIVVICLGTNDLGWHLPVANTHSDLQSIIDSVNDENRKIYIAKFYTEQMAPELAAVFGITDTDVTALFNEYNDMYTALAVSNNITLIEDIWTGVWGVHMSDEFHPNAAGYEIMANHIFNVLRPYLEANNFLK
jgi:acyl-CoA thioesterase-1